jgi:hypothetical protein
MIKKIVVVALIIAALVWFYNTFMSESMGGFFQKTNKVDLFQSSVNDGSTPAAPVTARPAGTGTVRVSE